MTFGAEPPRVEQKVAWNRDAVDGAADVDVRKVERLAVERDEALGPDLADIGPKIRQQLALVRLAVGARAIQLKPVHSDADDAAGARIEPETFENLLAVLIGFDVEQDLSSPG